MQRSWTTQFIRVIQSSSPILAHETESLTLQQEQKLSFQIEDQSKQHKCYFNIYMWLSYWTGSCKYSNQPMSSTEGGEFLDLQSDY
jgi:hypothetical protein